MMSNQKIWTEEEVAKLRELYPTTPATDLADVFHCSAATVLYKAHKLELQRDPSFSSHQFIGRYTHRRGKFNIYDRK